MKVVSVNISEKKGVIKKPVPQIILCETGVLHDAHSGYWNRQVSLLGVESFRKFEKQAGRTINYGEFAENITTVGLILYEAKPLDRLISENTELEITQIGKKCHGDNCAIFREVGNCVMPLEGIFARVIKSGSVQAGDEFEYVPKVFQTTVITLSDRASRGEYEDKSGPVIQNFISDWYLENKLKGVVKLKLIPDDPDALEHLLNESVDVKDDFVFMTGGTGIGHRDITPEVVSRFIDKEIPGIMEMIRIKYGAEKPAALLSRSIAGVKNNTLMYAMPGSVKAVQEYVAEIRKSMIHSVYMLYNLDLH